LFLWNSRVAVLADGADDFGFAILYFGFGEAPAVERGALQSKVPVETTSSLVLFNFDHEH
jgi:hypothetical protein